MRADTLTTSLTHLDEFGNTLTNVEPPSDPTPVAHPEYDFYVFLEQARYLGNLHQRRAASFDTKSAQLLASSGIVVALIAGLVAPQRSYVEFRILVGSAGGLFVIAALCAAIAMLPRKPVGPSLSAFRETYLSYRAQPGALARWELDEYLASMLIGAPSADPLLERHARDARTRGRWMRAGVIAFVLGLLPLAAAGGVLLVRG
jgi:hypothetical protein